MNSGTLLLVDEEKALRLALRGALCDAGFAVMEATRGEEALGILQRAHVDAVMLDSNLPEGEAIEICRRIRKTLPQVAILVLSVSEEEMIVKALNAGADDVIATPFRLRELMARIRAVVRRCAGFEEPGKCAVTLGDFVLDCSRNTIERRGRAIRLTPKQCKLLHYLMIHHEKAIPHRELLQSVWGSGYESEVEYLRTFIRQLRMRIEDDPSRPKCLLTERHFGYRFCA